MIRHCRPSHGIVWKSYIKLTRHQKGKQSKATSSYFSIKMIAKLKRTYSYVQQNMEQTQIPTMGATINNESTTTDPPLRTTNPFLVICMEKKYSENVSVDAFDSNTRLKKLFKIMLNVQYNTGISFYIVSIQV